MFQTVAWMTMRCLKLQPTIIVLIFTKCDCFQTLRAKKKFISLFLCQTDLLADVERFNEFLRPLKKATAAIRRREKQLAKEQRASENAPNLDF